MALRTHQSTENDHLIVICTFFAVKKYFLAFGDSKIGPFDGFPFLRPLRVNHQPESFFEAVSSGDSIAGEIILFSVLLIVEVVEYFLFERSAILMMFVLFIFLRDGICLRGLLLWLWGFNWNDGLRIF